MSDRNSEERSPVPNELQPRRRLDIGSPDLASQSPAARVEMHRVRVPSEYSPQSVTHDNWTRAMVTTIAALLVMGALYFASSLLVPVVIAALAYLSLRPIETKMCGWGIPQVAASGLLIVGLFSMLGLIVALLYSPAQRWIAAAPESLAEVRGKFESIAEPLTTLDRAEDTVDDATAPLKAAQQRIEVAYEKPSMVDEATLINQTVQMLAFVAAIAVLTFFMLSTGDDLLNRVLGVLPSISAREEMLEKIGDIQHSVGRYLAQITCINIGLGVAVTLVMWLVGMPTPVLWGVMAALFNFIPYVGPLAATSIVFLAAASYFDTIGRAGVVSFAFWLTTAVEGQFVTPAILGTTLRVGPVAVLIAVAFWGFLWGLPGVFLSVPLLIVQRKIFASFEATHAFAVVLGEDACEADDDCEPIQEDQPIAETAAV
ncbi:AI-2E family transporter [Aporhodopirellula aestuarii]|uniref:AI-2E family transporter n=1 Tax=Aporhodopirellula aestuarii TaxID=2950107 RepID=A0ABT0UC67_9BACT|nr:AI-2E family transporter [Aporhodopirellula aestuarii]MCM2374376.1 AI-2E family transporter [Aporhodopirellula aestuarii]